MIWSIDRDMITDDRRGRIRRQDLPFHARSPEGRRSTSTSRSLNSGLKFYGIYRLEGDALTICCGIGAPAISRKARLKSSSSSGRESRTPVSWPRSIRTPRAATGPIEPSGGSARLDGHQRRAHPSSSARTRGGLVVTLASVSRLVDGEPEREYRPVAFDDKKKRYLFGPAERGLDRPRRFARSRWPRANTGWIPHGCPTTGWSGWASRWSPPRCRQAEKAAAATGHEEGPRGGDRDPAPPRGRKAVRVLAH